MRATFSADQTKAPAVAAKTTPGDVTARRSPPSAGPAKLPTLSIVLEATFAAMLRGVARQRRDQRSLGGLEGGRDDATSAASA